MNYDKMLKFGRIVLAGAVGSLMGICTFHWNNIENYVFILVLLVAVFIVGVAMIYTANEELKSEKTKLMNDENRSKKCPNCGLSLTKECKKCPKCNTEIEQRKEKYYEENNF